MSRLELDLCIQAFLDTCDRGYTFPSGGKQLILSKQECSLSAALCDPGIVEADIFQGLQLCGGFTSYEIVIFGLRLAQVAARDQCHPKYRIAVLAVLASIPGIDWRDRIRALAVLEYCGGKFGAAFEELVQDICGWGPTAEKSDFAAYLARERPMRSLDVVGLYVSDEENGPVIR